METPLHSKRLRGQQPPQYCRQLVKEGPPETGYRRIFLPELVYYIPQGLYRKDRGDSCTQVYRWEWEDEWMVRRTLAAWCLVCHEWNKIFTPFLYRNIFLGGSIPIHTVSLLRRTLWHSQRPYQDLIQTMDVRAEDGSTTSILLAALKCPNLRLLILSELNISRLHPKLSQHIRLLSKSCTIRMYAQWLEGDRQKLLLQLVGFLRHAQPTECTLWNPCQDLSKLF